MRVIKRGNKLPTLIFSCPCCDSTLEAVEGELNDISPFSEENDTKEYVFFCPVCRTYRSVWGDEIKKGGKKDD